MLPGTRFFYDGKGRYRGKASDYGPITQGVWALAGLGFLGYLAFEWLLEAWWFLALIFAGAGLVIALAGIPILLWQKRSTAWLVGLLIISAVAVGALVVFESLPNMQSRRSEGKSETTPIPAIDSPAPSVPKPQTNEYHSPQSSNGDAAQVAPIISEAPRPAAPDMPAEQQKEFIRPSFNCQMATQNAEQMVCANHDLSRLDAEVDGLYKQPRSIAVDPSALRQSQRNWMYYERNACRTTSCLWRVYEERREYLASLIGR